MSYRVTFTNRSTGARESVVMPSENVAQVYARGVKDAVVELATVACAAKVEECPEGTLKAQRAASRGHHFAARAGRRYETVEVRAVRKAQEAAEEFSVDAESLAEQKMEHFSAAHFCGVSMATAYDDWDAGYR